jgi:hypothetical protein
MPIYKRTFIALFALSLLTACGGDKGPASNTSTGVTAMKEVPAVRLNFRYEGDVPAPQADQQATPEERNQAVQTDFDGGRPQDELLDKTISSPNKQNILAVWHRAGDAEGESRLDMYDAAGHVQKRLTPDSMSAKFPETIRWSPDSSTVAFVACIRTIATTNPLPVTAPPPPDASSSTDANTAPATTQIAPTPASPTGILAFRTEQIYIANADGSGVKSLTENEGLKYFYYVWSPDSTMLAALATTRREWQVQDLATAGKGEELVPYGRPRVIEKNGRERRLDDAPTQVQPVWSPDSAKIAVAYGNQIRVYDSLGTTPTQAAVPLRNQLLISSQSYDEQQKNLLNAANANTSDANVNANSGANSNAPAATPIPTPAQDLSILPDEKTLVSYNPIVALQWPQDDMIYLETAYVKRMKSAGDNVTSFARWHRVILSAQPAAPANK